MSSSATNTASTEVVGSSTSPTPPKKEEQTPNAKNETTAPKPKENQSAQNDSIVKSEEKENKTPVKATEERETEKTPPVQSPEAKENGASSDGPSLRQLFRAFSKFGDTKSDGKHLTLSQSDKWMKQAKVIDGKSITTTDTAIHFKKFKQMKISFPDYEKYLADLAKAKNIESQVLKNKLKNCGLPGTTGTTAVVKNQAVDRLTDTKKFTGSHKIRVDSPQKPKAGSPSPRK